jgi:Winged helix-turn-helix DNA-binding
MAVNITDAELQQMLTEGLSQNEIARRTGIPRSTLRRRIGKLNALNVYLSRACRKTPWRVMGCLLPLSCLSPGAVFVVLLTPIPFCLTCWPVPDPA